MANQDVTQGSQGEKSRPGGERFGNRLRGFAGMDPQQQREIASEGGRAAHEKGTAHEFTSEEARKAGRKGGEATAQQRRNEEARGNRSTASRSARSRPAAPSGDQAGSNTPEH